MAFLFFYMKTNKHFKLERRDISLPTKVHRVKAVFSSFHVKMWELDNKEGWTPKNRCFLIVVLEKTLESPLDCKEIQPVHPKGSVLGVRWKDWCWSWNSNPLATWWEELSHWKRPWCWERLRVREGGDSGWDSWMALPTQWTWVWANSRR